MDSLIVMRRPIKKRTPKPVKTQQSKRIASPRVSKPNPGPSHTVAETMRKTGKEKISFIKLYNDICMKNDKEIAGFRRVKSARDRSKVSIENERDSLRCTRSIENLPTAVTKGKHFSYGKNHGHTSAKRGARAKVMLEIEYTKQSSKK